MVRLAELFALLSTVFGIALRAIPIIWVALGLEVRRALSAGRFLITRTQACARVLICARIRVGSTSVKKFPFLKLGYKHNRGKRVPLPDFQPPIPNFKLQTSNESKDKCRQTASSNDIAGILRAFIRVNLTNRLGASKVRQFGVRGIHRRQARLHLSTPAKLIGVLTVFALSTLTGFIIQFSNQKPNQVVAATGINEQLNFQARLFSSTGALVPDGTYNIEFKILCGGDGTPDGTNASDCTHGTNERDLWTETRTGGNKVTVTNGYFNVQLGSVTAFGTSVDWNEDKLWLSINIGGSGSPSWDGEMSPHMRLTSVPYAFNAGKLDGIDSSGFVQLGPSSQQTDSSANTSININQTGGGNLLNLQAGGNGRLVLTNAGQLQLPVQGSGGGILFGSDANLYRSSADTLKTDDSLEVVSNLTVDTNTLYVSASGDNVGIGTTGPDRKLEVYDSTNPQLRLSQTEGSVYADFRMNASGDLVVNVDGQSDQLVLDDAGNVGIGTASPSAKLAVSHATSLNFGEAIRADLSASPASGTSDNHSSIYGFSDVTPTGGTNHVFNGVYGRTRSLSNDASLSTVTIQGVRGEAYYAGASGTLYRAIGLNGAVINFTTGTITNAYGLSVDSASNSGGGTITNNYGILVNPQTAGTNDYGVAIGASDTQTLWVSNNANNTTASAGIAFGSSRDTNLYRSAVDTLKTDGNLVVDGSTSGNALTVSNSTSTGSIAVFSDNATPVLTIADGGAITATQTLTVQGAGALTLGLTGTNTGQISFKGATGASGTINLVGQTNPTGTRTITLPDETGTICLQSSANCGFATGSGASVILQGSTPGSQQTGHLNISGTAIAGTSVLTPLLDASSATALNIGTTNATALNLNQNTTVLAGKSLTVDRGSGGLASALKVVGYNSTSFNIDTQDATGSLRVAIGADGSCTSGRLCVQQGLTGSGAGPFYNINNITTLNTSGSATAYGQRIYLDDDSSSIANIIYGQYITNTASTNNSATVYGLFVNNRSSNAGSLIELQSASTTVLSVNNAGSSMLFKPRTGTDSLTAFQVQPSGSATPVFNVDTSNLRIGINNASPGSTLDVTGTGNFSSTLTVQGASATVGTSSQSGSIILNDGSSNTGTIQLAALGSNEVYIFPDSDGSDTVCLLDLNNCATGGTVTLQNAYGNGNNITTSETDGDIEFDLADTATDQDFVVDIQGSGNVIQFQDGGQAFATFSDGGKSLFKPTSDAGDAFRIQNAGGGTTIFNVDTTNTRITVNGAPGDLAGRDLEVIDAQITTRLRVGTGSNYVDFQADGGQVYYGNARPTLKVTLAPEYPGATLYGSGTGAMTSNFCSDYLGILDSGEPCNGTNDEHNYYEWTSTNASTQSYSIYVRFQVPSDFDAGSLSTFHVTSHTTDTTDASIDVAVYNSSGTACDSDTTINASSNVWENSEALTSCAPSAGDIMVIKLTVNAKNSDYARVGEITFEYKSKF